MIVLAGSDPKDDSLRDFARALVDRPGTKILVWTDADVRALAAGRPAPQSLLGGEVSPEYGIPAKTRDVNHTGKYRGLWRWLRTQEAHPITVTFSDIENIIGMPLPESCRSHPAHWHSYEGSAVARAILDAGWKASQVHIAAGTVSFIPVTVSAASSPAKPTASSPAR